MSGFYNIQDGLAVAGIPLQLRRELDPSGYYNAKILAGLKVVDLIPVKYKATVFKAQEGAPSGQGAKQLVGYKLDFGPAIEMYKKRCQVYGLQPVDGVRLYVTDEMTSNENITVNWEPNIIEAAANKFQTKYESFKMFGDLVKSSGYDVELDKLFNEVVDKIASFFGSAGGAVGNFIKNVKNMLVYGYRISFPKIWSSTDYSSQFDLTVRLASPYGHGDAISRYIVQPLIYLVLLAAPDSVDGTTYGNQLPVRVRGYGITDIRLGCIQNISILRGARDTSFNYLKQPLTVLVNVTVTTLMPGFAAIIDGSDNASISDLSRPKQSYSAFQHDRLINSVGAMIDSFRPAPEETWKDLERFSPTGGGMVGGGSTPPMIEGGRGHLRGVRMPRVPGGLGGLF